MFLLILLAGEVNSKRVTPLVSPFYLLSFQSPPYLAGLVGRSEVWDMSSGVKRYRVDADFGHVVFEHPVAAKPKLAVGTGEDSVVPGSHEWRGWVMLRGSGEPR